jgi:hypothetical protein
VTERGGNRSRAPRGRTDVIPGAVVRDLMDNNEQRIAALERELAAALEEAEEAEGRVAGLSALKRSHTASEAHTTAPGDRRRNGPPRTTVVTRPRPQAG